MNFESQGTVLLLHHNLCSINVLSLKSLETAHFNQLAKGIKLFISFFVFTALTAHTHSDTGRRVLDSSGPDKLVQTCIQTDVLGSHGLLCKLANLLDRTGCASLELLSLDALGEVDRVVTCDEIRLGGTLDHFNILYKPVSSMSIAGIELELSQATPGEEEWGEFPPNEGNVEEPRLPPTPTVDLSESAAHRHHKLWHHLDCHVCDIWYVPASDKRER